LSLRATPRPVKRRCLLSTRGYILCRIPIESFYIPSRGAEIYVSTCHSSMRTHSRGSWVELLSCRSSKSCHQAKQDAGGADRYRPAQSPTSFQSAFGGLCQWHFDAAWSSRRWEQCSNG
jgi:hypothetical protein